VCGAVTSSIHIVRYVDGKHGLAIAPEDGLTVGVEQRSARPDLHRMSDAQTLRRPDAQTLKLCGGKAVR